MPYAPLTAGQGFLGWFTSLDSTRKTEAEAEADRFIDIEFHDWDRASWSGSPPQDIKEIALRWGSKEYIEKSFAATNPDGADLPIVRSLEEDAMRRVTAARARGWVMGSGGEKIMKEAAADAPKSSRNVYVRR